MRFSAFAGYHPLVSLTFFTLVVVCAMFFLHPLALLIALTCAACYSIRLGGRSALRFNLIYLLPLMLLAALLNPAFNHRGLTVLTYLPGGNPLTWESICYGLAAAAMVGTVICWFSCFNLIMTSDKIIYLFGRIIPALSLTLSMVLRFVPRFARQARVIADGQSALGRGLNRGSPLQRARCAVTIFSALVTWALENSVEMADSMKSRGYGLRGRTAYALFRLERRDKQALAFLWLLGAYVLLGAACGGMKFIYFPALQGVGLDLYTLSLFAAYFVLCAWPLFTDLREEKKWLSIQSKI